MWIGEVLKEAMNVVEKRTCFLKRASKSWNTLLNFHSNHVNGKTRSRKMRLGGVLRKT